MDYQPITVKLDDEYQKMVKHLLALRSVFPTISSIVRQGIRMEYDRYGSYAREVYERERQQAAIARRLEE